MALVDVDDVGDADVLDAGEMLVVIEPASALGPGRMTRVETAQTDDRDVDRVVRALATEGPARERSQSGSRGGGFDRNVRRFMASLQGGRSQVVSSASPAPINRSSAPGLPRAPRPPPA